MKKVLLSLLAATAVMSVNAQQRLVLYEEFSGENCGPCATYNPALMSLLGANSTKTILLKYQSPIPSAGPIYEQNTADVDARLTYYSVPFAPYGRQDGAQVGTGNISNHTQAAIDAAYNVPTPFTITANHTFSSDWDSIFINITVATTGAFNGTTMKMRTALVEHLTYTTPPGSNGETDFKNVMRKMYPDAAGTTIPNTWTSGQTQSYTISGPVPAYVDRTNTELFVIVWLQDDANKVIAQAAKTSPLPPIQVDVKSDAVAIPSTLLCSSGSASVVPTVTIKNTGTTTLTSANIFTKVDVSGTWALAQAWTGSLNAGATTTVTLPALTVPAGSHFILDSVAMPNGTPDYNPINNFSFKGVNVVSTATNPLNITSGFENSGNVPAGWVMYDANDNGAQIFVTRVTNQNYGHGSSTYFMYHNNFGYPANEANYAILPMGDLSGAVEAIDFWVASAPYTSGNPEPDKLEIVYSTNCGQNWTSVWSQQGAALNTAAATTNAFLPSQASHWQQRSVNVSSIPTGAMVAFRATSGYGNNLFIDDVNLRHGFTLGVEAFTAANANMSLFPNPATDKATLSFVLNNSSDVQVQVLDAVGRLVATVANGNLDKGQQNIEISTANFAAGVYNVLVKTDAGVVTERLTVVK